MALDKDALSELLDALRAGGDLDLVRSGLQLVLQALIEHGGRPGDRRRPLPARAPSGRLTATAPASGCSRPRPATWSCGSRSCATGSFFPSLLEPRRRIDRALWAVVMEAYVHGVSTRKVDDLVRALGIDAGISQVRGLADLRRARRAGRGLPRPLARPQRLPVPVPGCHLPEGPRGPARRVKGGGDRHRRARRRRPRGARPGRRRLRGRGLLDGLPALACGPAASAASSWSSPTPTRASRAPSPR